MSILVTFTVNVRHKNLKYAKETIDPVLLDFCLALFRPLHSLRNGELRKVRSLKSSDVDRSYLMNGIPEVFLFTNQSTFAGEELNRSGR